ncbi:MAG: diguanylate cyclase [Deltaproteobacteria bacterium]|nr:diguanylate cyclase [Deltaproteobacteria bacterium]
MAEYILIVDDDADIRQQLSEYIDLSGYISSTAADAEEAINLLKNKKYDVVITDIKMPGMDGLALTDTIKKRYASDVIVITGYSENYSYEEAVKKGASDFVFKPVRLEELLLRLKRVLRERQLRKHRNYILEKLQKLAITDGLTKLHNSRHFYYAIELEIDRSKRYNHPLGLLLLDIDNFKQYNDSYGHLEGDKVLATMGRTIKSLLRTMDSAYRYGGEEFTIILPETNIAKAETVGQRIRAAIKSAQFFPESGKPVSVTISVGVTQYSPQETVSSFVQRADKAMYISKQHGKNLVTALLSGQADNQI